jgi:hypothetical protein
VTGCGTHRVLPRIGRSTFPPANDPCPTTVHPAFDGGVHPPSNVRPLQSMAACCLPAPAPPPETLRPPKTARVRAPPVGFCALIATSAGGVHTRAGSHSRASVRPRRFARPRRFSPLPAWRVCFTPLPRPGFAPSGVCPSPRSRTGFRRPGALVPLDLPACGCPRQRTDRRLQGLAPRAECGGLRGGETPETPRPSWACASFGCSPRTPSQRLHAASARGLRRIEPDARDPRRLAGARIGWRGITLPTRARFSA